MDSIELNYTLNGVETAIDFGISFEPDRESELIFIHVLENSSEISMSEKDRIRSLKEKKVRKEFERIKEMCENKGIENIRTMLKKEEPSKKIVETTQEEDADLIVMGSGKLHNGSPKGRIQKFFYGSVTEEVVHKAPCSILVARPPNEERKLDRILIPIDSITFDNTLRAIEESIRLGIGFSGEPELIFMHVWNVESFKEAGAEERLRNLRKEAMEKEFKEIKKMCREKGLKNFKTVFKIGADAHEEIVNTAKEENTDLIVMGSGKLHDKSAEGRFKKFIYGSVTEKVIHQTPCSILITKPK